MQLDELLCRCRQFMLINRRCFQDMNEISEKKNVKPLSKWKVPGQKDSNALRKKSLDGELGGHPGSERDAKVRFL